MLEQFQSRFHWEALISVTDMSAKKTIYRCREPLDQPWPPAIIEPPPPLFAPRD